MNYTEKGPRMSAVDIERELAAKEAQVYLAASAAIESLHSPGTHLEWEDLSPTVEAVGQADSEIPLYAASIALFRLIEGGHIILDKTPAN